jgi:hypothetical protein
VIRPVFLAACDTTRPLLAAAAVAEGWDEPSALEQMTVGALAGHLMRAVTSVDAYLDRSAPAASDVALDAPGYFLSIDGLSDSDLDSELHTAIRGRAAAEAEAGHQSVVEQWDQAVERLRARLDGEPRDRLVPALGGRTLTLDEYLITRLVEMVVHVDDLAVSVGAERPGFARVAEEAVMHCLLEMARRRHGDRAVVTALTRRERDAVQALRVL